MTELCTQLLSRGRPPADALRRAQLALLSDPLTRAPISGPDSSFRASHVEQSCPHRAVTATVAHYRDDASASAFDPQSVHRNRLTMGFERDRQRVP